MAETIGVAEAKRRFSEYMSRTHYKGERFVIERKGKPVAAMVSIDDLKSIEQGPGGVKKGLLAAVGAWGEYDELDELVDQIYSARDRAADRRVNKLN